MNGRGDREISESDATPPEANDAKVRFYPVDNANATNPHWSKTLYDEVHSYVLAADRS
jgi:hypothetical protein